MLMKSIFILSFISLFSFFNTQAQDIYWPEEVLEINTEANSTYLIQSVNIDGTSIIDGFVLGAFFTNDSGGLQCGGITNCENGPVQIAVWGDDTTTEEKDGFYEGEEITWLAFGSIAELTYTASVLFSQTLPYGSNTFSTNGLNIVADFNISSAVLGCMVDTACNYNTNATEEDYSCTYAEENYNCDSSCIDTDGDLVCDTDEVEACTDITSLNYNEFATDEDGSCQYLVSACSDTNYLEYYFNPIDVDFTSSQVEDTCTNLITNNGITASQFEEPLNTGTNMTVAIPEGMLSQFEGGIIAAFYGDLCVGYGTITTSFMAMGIWGDDSSTDEVLDGLLTGQVPSFAVLYNGGVISLYQNELTGYQNNGLASITNFQISEPLGCTSTTACNYSSDALIDDGTCYYSEEYYNCAGFCINDLDSDGICNELEIPGCMLWGYNNYNELATDDDASCSVSWEEDYINLALSFDATLDSLQNAYNLLEVLSISIDLLSGWNIIGYTNSLEQDAVLALAEIEDLILVFKDNNADVYMPEYGFNGIGNLIPGQGYQLKLSEEFNNFSFENSLILGCTDVNACNFNVLASQEDNSCIYPEQNLDCEGNCLNDVDTDGICDENQIALNYEIGDEAFGGIVFYIDESGEHGLVASLEDITEGSNMGSWGTAEGYEWGCYQQTVSGAEGTDIGTGLDNTEAIVSQNCQTVFGGITATQATLNYETEGYTDWYLPSKNELEEMYNSIGNGGLEGNIGGFETSDYPYYWSSTEYSINYAWFVSFDNGGTYSSKDSSLRVRAVRAF
jgi:hypothetical protein